MLSVRYNKLTGIIIMTGLLLISLPASAIDLTGRVVDKDGVALSHIRITLTVETLEPVSKVSGPDGSFRFGGIVGGNVYTIQASGAGHTFTDQSGVTSSTLLTLEGTAVYYNLGGKVVTGDNTPVSGVQIDAGGLGKVTTDAQGRFYYAVPYKTSYVLSASKAGMSFTNNDLSGVVYGHVSRVIVGDTN